MIAGDAVESRMEVVAALAHGAHAAGIARLVTIKEAEPAVAGEVQGQSKGGDQAHLDERRPGWQPGPSADRRPTIRPGLAFLGIYTFIAAWNDYIWPLIVLVNPGHVTLQVALAQLNTTHATDYSMVMAGAMLALLPVVAVFILFARQFVSGAIKGAIRG